VPNASVVVPPRLPAETHPHDAAIALAAAAVDATPITVAVAPELASTLVAREVPEPDHAHPIGAPESDALRAGAVEPLPGGALRVVDAWSTERGGRRLELRLVPTAGGPPSAEVGVWDLDAAGAARAWTGIAGTLSISCARWAAGEAIVVRYALSGKDGGGSPARKSGLVRIRAPDAARQSQ
jgi:hypothetical protein